ncbi:MAG: DUF6508 domain-containing protein [Coriobacteriaceae bacterium]|nr:DUF6508 domain-containing protein [Coriobacteriaceae bacterium]
MSTKEDPQNKKPELKKFKKITDIIPILESEEEHGKWIVDTEHKGTQNNPIQLPFVEYSKAASMLIYAVYDCLNDLRGEMNMRNYVGVLEDNGLKNGEDILAVDSSRCDAKCTLAMILMIIRQDRFSEGLLLDYLENGKMLEWMKRLAEIDGQ